MVGNAPFWFPCFCIWFLGHSHKELALSTKVHVILAVREILLQTKPNQSLPDTTNPGEMMAGRWQKQCDPPSLCLGCSLLLAAGVCVRGVSAPAPPYLAASQPEFHTESAPPPCLLGHITPHSSYPPVLIRKPECHFASLMLVTHPDQTSQESQEGKEFNGILCKAY